MKYPGFEDGPDAISWHTCTEPKTFLRSLLGHTLETLAKAGAGRPVPGDFVFLRMYWWSASQQFDTRLGQAERACSYEFRSRVRSSPQIERELWDCVVGDIQTYLQTGVCLAMKD